MQLVMRSDFLFILEGELQMVRSTLFCSKFSWRPKVGFEGGATNLWFELKCLIIFSILVKLKLVSDKTVRSECRSNFGGGLGRCDF